MAAAVLPAALLPTRPTIGTERLMIRLVESADLPALFEVNADDAVTRFLPYPSWKTADDGQAWHDRTLARHASGEVAQFVIALRGSGQVIGSCLLFRFEAASARAELGYVLGRAHWGAGYMLEAMHGFVAFAFEQLHLRRLEAVVDPRNAASARLLERLGFVREGLQRQRDLMKGEIVDSMLYGLLRDEWIATRAQTRR